MLTGIKAVIFDMDGTLTDSMWMWEELDREFLTRYGKEMPSDLNAMLGGRSIYESALFFKDYFGIPDSTDDIIAIWNEMALENYTHKVPLKNNAGKFLKLLKENNYKIGIATSNSIVLAKAALQSNNIYHLFDSIITGDLKINGKPAPDVYLKTAEKLNVLPNECLVFEDVLTGVMAGKSAGMKVCTIYDKFSDSSIEALTEISDYYIHDYIEIIDKCFAL